MTITAHETLSDHQLNYLRGAPARTPARAGKLMPMSQHHESSFQFNRIIAGDSRDVLSTIPHASVDLSFWSPPYFVGKSYEKQLTFEGWQRMIQEVVQLHQDIIAPGGFLVINIGDILCFPDETIPRYQANNVQGKKVPVSREDVARVIAQNPSISRKEIAALLGCSEQTVQRRMENNNVRGGKANVSTKIMLTGSMLVDWCESSGFYLYDKRIWHKEPCWANSRWHSNSYRAVDEFEHIYVYWKPGITEYDRGRLDACEWSEWGSRGVWKINSVRKNDRHEAEFPKELARRVIRLYSPESGTVIDPFVGTGTTALVAKELGRQWLGIDMVRDYVQIAQNRVNSVL